jgi:hypothetical protein
MPLVPSNETLRRIQAEFLEMPGLKLTVPQAARLWGVDPTTCETVIETLIRAHFLRRTRDGAITRLSDAV